jgi:hypothetical protein
MKPFARVLVALALLAAFVFAACDDDEEPGATETPTTAGATETAGPATPTTGTTPGATAPFEGSLGPVEQEGAVAPPMPLLTHVRTGEHEGYDRITFEFEGARPGYRIEYAEPPFTQDPSDLPVEIAGNAFLKVRLESASAHDDAGEQTVDVTEIMAGLPSIVEAEQTGDFEGVVNWVIGLSAEANFRVGELDGPTRIYIDVLHP